MVNIDLTGKNVVITGATGQLGRVMAKTLAECGANVAVCYKSNEQMAQSLVKELEASYGINAVAVSADVKSLDSIMEMKQKVNQSLGKVDIIVNNAVSQYKWTSVLEQNPADFQDQFETCTMHNVNMAKAFVPDMQESGWGRVIGINSECAALCNPDSAAYSAAKRGMDGILRCLAKEVGANGITVNQVAPGWTISQRDRDNGTQADEAYDKTVPLGHRGTDQDIANAVAFLASNLAQFITGIYLPVCGGRVMPGI